MDRLFNLNLPFFQQKPRSFVLASVWICGLLLGAVFSGFITTELSSSMLSAVRCGVSLFGLLAIRLLPFLLSALSIYFSQPILLCAVVFLKAFLYSHFGTGLLITYRSAGWILFNLLTFSDTLILPVLWLFWLRGITDRGHASYHVQAIGALYTVAVTCIDYTYIAPYLVRLISL